MNTLFRIIFPFALLFGGATVAAQNRPPLVEVGVSAGTRFFIVTSSVQTTGQVVRYQLTGTLESPNEPPRPGFFRAEVGVDCKRRTRVEYVATVDAPTRAGRALIGDEMRSVYDGTRQAIELEAACAIAADAARSSPTPTKPSVPDGGQGLPVAPGLPSPADGGTSQQIKSTGSGFVIAAGNLAVTNFHVVNGCQRVVGRANSWAYTAEVLVLDRQNDLALVRLKGGREIPPLPISGDPEELGAAVVVLGYPLTNVLGTDLRVTTGIVSSLSGVGGQRQYMQISAPVQPGNSGGPVLDRFGNVNGVVVSKLAARYSAESVNFAIRGPILRSFLEINEVRPSSAKRSSELPPAEIVRRSASSTILFACF